MSTNPPWTLADRATLATQLEAGTVHTAHDVDGVSIYHYRLNNSDRIAVALPGGHCIMIGSPEHAIPHERRRPGDNV